MNGLDGHYVILTVTEKYTFSMTHVLWSLETDPADRSPEATFRVASEGEPLLQLPL